MNQFSELLCAIAKSRALYLFVVATLAALSLCSCDPQTRAERPRSVMVAQPKQRADSSVSFPGEIRAQFEPPLAFRVAGKIRARLVDVGTHVTKGEALAELDDADLRIELESALAEQLRAQASVRLDQTEYARFASLREKQMINQSALDSKQAALVASQASLTQANARLAARQRQLAYATLTSPSDGTIADVRAEYGQVVAAGQLIFTLASDGPREAHVAIPERAIAQFALGDAMEVSLWTAPDRSLPATLTELAPAADPLTRMHKAKVRIDPTNEQIELGASALVTRHLPVSTALVVPLTAVLGTDQGHTVWRIDPRTALVHQVAIEVDQITEDGAVVRRGITSKDWIVLAGAHLLREGELINPIDRSNRPVLLQKETSP